MDRPHLALQINSVTLLSDDPWNQVRASPLENVKVLWDHSNDIKARIEQLVRPIGMEEYKFMTAWYDKITNRADPSLDGTLALILCMSSNLERITLTHSQDEDLDFVHEILSYSWNSTVLPHQPYPFHKLKSLYWNGWWRESTSEDTISILHTLNTLKVESHYNNRPTRRDQLSFPRMSPAALPLKNLILINAGTFSPSLLQNIVSLPWLKNLRKLVIHGGQHWIEERPEVYDYQRLALALEEHLPNLSVFGYTGQKFVSGIPSTFGSLSGMKNLAELYVDLDLIAPVDDYGMDCLKNPYTLFPPNLKHLRLSNIAPHRLENLVDNFYQGLHVDESEDEGATVSEAIGSLASAFPIDNVELGLQLEDWDSVRERGDLSEPDLVTISFLRDAADTLVQKGVHLGVYKMSEQPEDEVTLVVPGFTEHQSCFIRFTRRQYD